MKSLIVGYPGGWAIGMLYSKGNKSHYMLYFVQWIGSSSLALCDIDSMKALYNFRD